MKVLIAADIFPPESGGPATYSVLLANELVKKGICVEIAAINSNADLNAVNCKVFSPRMRVIKILKYFAYFCILIKYGRDADVIYAMGPVNAGLPAFLASWILAKPFVVKVVGDYAWEQGVQRFSVTDSIDDFQNKKFYPPQVRFLKLVESLVVRRANRVITPCKYLKHIVELWGAKSDSVNVVYNAIEEQNCAVIQKPKGEQWILYAGRLVPWKGVGPIVDAMSVLRGEMPEARLVIVGDGNERKKLEIRVKNLHLENCVSFVGSVPREIACGYIKASDVVVLNSSYEGLSHVLLEAISAGVPVAASSVGGNTEIVDAGVNGELFECDNREQIREKIKIILQSYKINAYAAIPEQFQLSKMIDRTIHTLQSARGDDSKS